MACLMSRRLTASARSTRSACASTRCGLGDAPLSRPAAMPTPQHSSKTESRPYSPELNPVEHLWDELREKHFHNRVFASLAAVEQHLFEAVRAFELDTERIRSICAWPWIIDAVSNAK